MYRLCASVKQRRNMELKLLYWLSWYIFYQLFLPTIYLLINYFHILEFDHLINKGMLDSAIGRKEEMELLIEALTMKRNSHACLVGNAGVGKTAMVEALAKKIVRYSVPAKLMRRKVIRLIYHRILVFLFLIS